jgi:hypothetical protein
MNFATKAIFSLFIAGCASVQAAPILVRAVAEDTQAVVIADANGGLQRLARSDAVAGTAWRFAGVSGGKAVFAHQRIVNGGRLEVSVAIGERIDLDAVAASSLAPPQPTGHSAPRTHAPSPRDRR